MSKKTMRDIALVMIAVFAITIIVYPLIFSPDQKAPKVDVPPPAGVTTPASAPAATDN